MSRIVDDPFVEDKCDQSLVVQAPVAVSLGALQRPLEDDCNELLKTRYLCRGGGLLLVGPTGVGKSSFSMQCMLLWSLGRSAFGIQPARPLKSLLIQAENDDGDLAEMRDGVIKGLELQEQEAQQAFANISVCRQDAQTGMAFFQNTVRPLLESHPPDLLWIDPALAYLGGEANSQEAVGGFLRNLLNPLLHEFKCAAVVVHHTNKPPKKSDGNGWTTMDFSYLGAGSAEWANWARAVLALRSTPQYGIFELCAAKRGGRLNWRAPDESTRIYSKYIAHAVGDGEIYWRPATEGEVESAQAGGKSIGTNDIGKVLGAIPAIGSIEKGRLLEVCHVRNIGRDKATKLIAQLIQQDKIHQVQVPRPKARPEIHLAHGPAPADPEAENDDKASQPASTPPSPPPMDDPPSGALTVNVTVGEGALGYSGCYDGSKTVSSNSRSNHQEDDVPPSGLLLRPAPLKGAVVTAGGSSSGWNQEDHPHEGPMNDRNHSSGLNFLSGSEVTIDFNAATGKQPQPPEDHPPVASRVDVCLQSPPGAPGILPEESTPGDAALASCPEKHTELGLNPATNPERN